MSLLALMAASLASAPVAVADRADLRCIAVFSMMANQMPEEKEGITGVIMFYFGRIEGRGAGLDVESSLNLAVGELENGTSDLKTEAQRCGKEMMVKGDEVQRIGNSLAAKAPEPSGKD
jgi:hypothetical protein